MATDLDRLRGLVTHVALAVAHSGRHVDIAPGFAAVGLPVPSDEGSKTERAQRAAAAVPDERLPEIAQQMLARRVTDAATRNAMQDLLWAAEQVPDIPKRTRRDIARTLDLGVFLPAYAKFKTMLQSLWDLGADPFGGWLDRDTSLGGEIDQHVARNPGDWSAEDLFDRLGAFDASNKRFSLFLEHLASAEAVPDEDGQRSVVAMLNPHLATIGLHLRETGIADGYPVFHLTSVRAHRGRPKNLIFASTVKPDLRLSDAIDNDVEIVSGADQVLVYDRPITPEGLRWRDLQAWWKETQLLDSDQVAKKSLWNRLRQSLPQSSPPQQKLFEYFHEIHGDRVHDLPALLPEVWLHWDPIAVKARKDKALPNFRMDFLMLLPGSHRIVLEVDGKHHYASGDLADPKVYADTVRADRDLKLARYDVYRFGAAELDRERTSREMLRSFFKDLFNLYGLS